MLLVLSIIFHSAPRSKSGLGSPLDAPGNRSNFNNYRGFPSRKSGSTYDINQAITDPSNFYGTNSFYNQQPDLNSSFSHEKAEKQILIEQNLKLAQELKLLKFVFFF